MQPGSPILKHIVLLSVVPYFKLCLTLHSSISEGRVLRSEDFGVSFPYVFNALGECDYSNARGASGAS